MGSRCSRFPSGSAESGYPMIPFLFFYGFFLLFLFAFEVFCTAGPFRPGTLALCPETTSSSAEASIPIHGCANQLLAIITPFQY